MSKETVFDVSGMSCMGCVRHVTEAVQKIAGVEKIEVSLEAGKVKVAHDGRSELPGAVVAALDEQGYPAKPA